MAAYKTGSKGEGVRVVEDVSARKFCMARVGWNGRNLMYDKGLGHRGVMKRGFAVNLRRELV